MKKAIFMISCNYPYNYRFYLLLNACNLKKDTTEIKDSGQSTVREQQGKYSNPRNQTKKIYKIMP